MSRLPCEQKRIKQPDGGGEYAVLPSRCARPGCERSAVHGHHAVPRSYTTSWPSQDWALLDGNLVPVVIPLCWQHHQDCTENISRIAWEHRWYWEELGHTKERDLWLIDHPRVWPALGDADGQEPAQDFLRSPASISSASPNADLLPGEACPKCGRRLPHEKKQASPTSKPVGFRVPVDALEDYKAHLGMWKDELGISKEPFADYKATLTAVAYCTQNAAVVLAEIERRVA